MAISNANKTKMNKMNRVAQNVSLGNIIQNLENDVSTAGSDITTLGTNGVSGSVVVIKAQMSASAVVVGFTGKTKGIFLYQVTDGVSGSNLSQLWFRHTRSGSNLTVIPHDSGSLAVGDKINYFIA